MSVNDLQEPVRPNHPAHLPLKITFLFVALIVIFGFISAFVPWAKKELSVGVRAWAFPFKTCIEKTFSEINEETCMDNDWMVGPKGVPLTGGNPACKAYILTTIAFVFLSVLLGALSLILMGLIFAFIWRHPVLASKVLLVLLVLVSISCLLAWIFFIIYMETTCAPDSIFPVSPGYAYGFIMYLFNTIFSFVAIGFGIQGVRRIHSSKDIINIVDITKGTAQDEEQGAPVDYPYPPYEGGETPVYPVLEFHPATPVQTAPAFY